MRACLLFFLINFYASSTSTIGTRVATLFAGTVIRSRNNRFGQATTRSATMTLPLVSGPKTSPKVQLAAPTQAPTSIGIVNPKS